MTRDSVAVAFREGTSRAGRFVATRPDWVIERFARMPTTNFLFLLTAYLAGRTCEHYMRTPGWIPTPEWLGFILGVSGSAVFQWVKKRTTDHEYQRIQRGGGNGIATDADGTDTGRDLRRTSGPGRSTDGAEDT